MEEPLFIQSNEIVLLTPTKSLKEITLSRGLQKTETALIAAPPKENFSLFLQPACLSQSLTHVII